MLECSVKPFMKYPAALTSHKATENQLSIHNWISKVPGPRAVFRQIHFPLSVKEPWSSWLGAVPCSCSIAGSSHSVSALLFPCLGCTATGLCPLSIKTLLSTPVALMVVLFLVVLSVPPGNDWLRQDGGPQLGWFLVSAVQRREQVLRPKPGFQLVRTLEKCLSTKDILPFEKTSQTLPWPEFLAWEFG